jgi:histone acetyltransferase (RNA polymerase elongator complex component)
MVKTLRFEQGPIRPPNEARSFLLRVTRNCPWNQCLFCPVYKTRKFSLRSVEEIKKDIQVAKDISDRIKEISWKIGSSGLVTDKVLNHIFNSPEFGMSWQSIAVWLYCRTNECFLQDADNLVMKPEELVEVLKFLREKFPDITRITTYARSRTIVRRSLEELKDLRQAGLNRIHVGLESGSDAVLKFMKKGVTAVQHIDAGKMVLDAGMELSEYVMPGLGGQDLWKEHAIETAHVLNEINPDFIRLRSLRVPDRASISEKVNSGEFKMMTDDMLVDEIKLFVNSLVRVTGVIASDHIMNLLEDVAGRMPDDKEKILGVIMKYQKLSDEERLIYRVGRRGGIYHSTDDLERDPVKRKKIEDLIFQIRLESGEEGIEKLIADTGNQYI